MVITVLHAADGPTSLELGGRPAEATFVLEQYGRFDSPNGVDYDVEEPATPLEFSPGRRHRGTCSIEQQLRPQAGG